MSLLLATLFLAVGNSSVAVLNPLDAYSECVKKRASENRIKADPEEVARHALTACKSRRSAAVTEFLKARQRMGHWEMNREDAGASVDSVALSRVAAADQN
ncbi:hypothetical protein [Sphingomonas sp. Leaf231]|uniref:hypothetical protein n=1 Tax=Sphingomonas sp. Leaf231 TaxID=1736301 RepID=UPI0012E2E3A2|nr:hypothetical protein [Sphingomonas sp. Leaf231]